MYNQQLKKKIFFPNCEFPFHEKLTKIEGNRWSIYKKTIIFFNLDNGYRFENRNVLLLDAFNPFKANNCEGG